ncbi:hypothetical protein OC842_005983 [Tilletia horrida]|uniref:Translin n=1 Tax=Tilletia horrida TaxID=155126 RepID=A0AAN6G6D9_9BASI|nr:hypothetical protein OC842_005983 [Tilletia horrida]
MAAEARGSKRPSPEQDGAGVGQQSGASAPAPTASGDGAVQQQGQQQQEQQQRQPHFKRKRTGPGPSSSDPGKGGGGGAGSSQIAHQTRPIGRAFAQFSGELDRFQDRRERLIKISRDVTALSKKLIFHLHRWEHADVELPSAYSSSSDAPPTPAVSVEQQALEGGRKRNAKLLAEARQKLAHIVDMLKEAARAESLSEGEAARKKAARADAGAPVGPDSMEISTADGQGEGAEPAPPSKNGAPGNARANDSDEQPVFLSPRYDRAFGPGIEEFIEAVSFLHFLEHDTIITLDQVQSHFLDDGRAPTSEAGIEGEVPEGKSTSLSSSSVLLRITPERYLLGLSDLTGELMRYATNALASPAAQKANVVPRTLDILRTLADQFEPFSGLIWDFHRKQRVTIQSLRKIEQLSYSLTVRSVEFGSDPGTLAEIVRRALAAGNAAGGAGGEGDGNADDRDD